MRRVFRESGLLETVLWGGLRERIRKDAVPIPPPPGEPRGTRSQYISYFDEAGNEVARVHRYLRPDGSIGASGLPDPKAVLHEGALYYCDMNY